MRLGRGPLAAGLLVMGPFWTVQTLHTDLRDGEVTQAGLVTGAAFGLGLGLAWAWLMSLSTKGSRPTAPLGLWRWVAIGALVGGLGLYYAFQARSAHGRPTWFTVTCGLAWVVGCVGAWLSQRWSRDQDTDPSTAGVS